MIAAFLTGASLQTSTPGETDCRHDLIGKRQSETGVARAVRPMDLVRLRDFGRQDSAVGGEPPFSVSPDGSLAAFVLRRADPVRDDFCIAVAVVPLDGRGEVRFVDVGGQLIVEAGDVRGIPDLPIGTAKPITPRWSPDGRWLAYLRRDGNRTRAWRARADGSGAEPVSSLDIEVRDVQWSKDGATLLVTTRPGVAAGEALINAEERTGFLYDRRFWTLSLARPKPPLPIEDVTQRIDPKDGRVIETTELGSAEEPARPEGAITFARSSTGARAWTSADDPKVMMGSAALRVQLGDSIVTCPTRYCADGVGAIWWGDDDELFFIQRGSPENGGATSLLSWRAFEKKEPRLVVSTEDALVGCQPGGGAIICAWETATRPRVLAKIDPTTGTIASLYDPNPEFSRLKKGSVQRLRLEDRDGVRTYADLVLPPDHRQGERHPLVVVQYHSRGFLRGGTGDEYPIHAFATRGFAVLSMERTPFVGAGKAGDLDDLLRIHTDDFAERRRVLSSVETGVKAAIDLGVADAERIGITGLSDGAATVQFALVNSKLFHAAAVSSCCDEPSTSMFAAGIAYGDMLMDAGFPAPGSDGSTFWRGYSLAANADRIRTPILLQLTEDEFRFGLETFATLDHHRVPVEMYVFADGYHQKWRAAHRLAVYERAIDWFDFWLNGKVDEAPGKVAQYRRWRALSQRQAP